MHNFIDPATAFASMRRPKIDRTALMNPQWARWFDQTAEAQGLDTTQPYNLNLAGDFGRPSLNAMRPAKKTSYDALSTDDLIAQSTASRGQSQDLLQRESLDHQQALQAQKRRF